MKFKALIAAILLVLEHGDGADRRAAFQPDRLRHRGQQQPAEPRSRRKSTPRIVLHVTRQLDVPAGAKRAPAWIAGPGRKAPVRYRIDGAVGRHHRRRMRRRSRWANPMPAGRSAAIGSICRSTGRSCNRLNSRSRRRVRRGHPRAFDSRFATERPFSARHSPAYHRRHAIRKCALKEMKAINGGKRLLLR